MAASSGSEWSLESGTALNLSINKYVEEILYCDYVTKLCNDFLKIIGYRISGINVEKILISTSKPSSLPSWVNSKARVPYDAMLWFTLEEIDSKK